MIKKYLLNSKMSNQPKPAQISYSVSQNEYSKASSYFGVWKNVYGESALHEVGKKHKKYSQKPHIAKI